MSEEELTRSQIIYRRYRRRIREYQKRYRLEHPEKAKAWVKNSTEKSMCRIIQKASKKHEDDPESLLQDPQWVADYLGIKCGE